MRMTRSGPWLNRLLVLSFVLVFGIGHASGQAEEVTLILDSTIGSAARHGVAQLMEALRLQDISVRQSTALKAGAETTLIVVGPSSGSSAVSELADAGKITLPTEPESLLIHQVPWKGQNVLLICGHDDRGLMYALLEVAEHLRLTGKSSDLLSQIENVSEQPSVRERGVTRMLMNRAVVEKYFYSEDYWKQYLNMLAKDRYNSFTLMFGYGAAGYFEPLYPFLFDVPEFPEIRVVGITKEEQRRNLEMLRSIVELTRARGLQFTAALWTHLFVPGHNNYLDDGFTPKKGFPVGLTEDNFIPYTKIALARFLKLFPEIDRLQFRVHVESSVVLPEQSDFWREIFEVVEATRPGLPVDMRVKGFSDDLIGVALDSPLKVRLTTKHWGEEMGLPYHPTQDSLRNKYKRRHSYADLLTYPKRYEMLWRLWTHGTVKVLLWGEPDAARRFVESTRLYDGAGFELHEPLAMKMGYKRALHDQEPYDVVSPDYQSYEWEFERYWYFYQLFGRLGYNSATSPRVWKREFEARFGTEAAPFVEEAYASASKVLPRIVAYATRDLSAGYSWPEKRRWEDLPVYVNVRPSDTAQFLGIEEAARFYLEGKDSARIWPRQNSAWFEKVSHQILSHVQEAKKRVEKQKNKEFAATMVDMEILAFLAAYHSRRLHSGMAFALFEKTGDRHALKEAIRYEGEAIEQWKKIVAVADGVYSENIIMGRAPDMEGNWKTELQALEKGLDQLSQLLADYRPKYRERVAVLDFGDGPVEEGLLGVSSRTRYELSRGGFGWHHAYLKPSPKLSDGMMEKERYRDFLQGPEPDQYTYSAFGIDLPRGEYELRFSMVDRSDHPQAHGPMWIVAEGRDSTKWFDVPVGEIVEKTLRTTVSDGRLDFVFNSTTDGDWIVSSLTIDRVEPMIGHVPIRRISGRQDLVLRATVAGPDAIRSVHLSYGNELDYKRLEMRSSGDITYEAVIPRSEVGRGLSYFIEVADEANRRAWFPREGAEKPILVSVTEDSEGPEVSHQHVSRWEPGRTLEIKVEAKDPSGVAAVRVCHRGVNQHQDFNCARLFPAGRETEYKGEIPGDQIDGRWDFMYYIEALDTFGNGRIYPDLDRETPYVLVRLHDE